MKKLWFSIFLCLLVLPMALAEETNVTPVLISAEVQVTTTDVSNIAGIATQYDLSNSGVADQIRSQIKNTVAGWFNDAVASTNTYRERVMEIAEDVRNYDFNYFCPPAVVMTPRNAAIGWIVDKAKEQEWLRELYRDHCPTQPDQFIAGLRDYLQENEIPLQLRQACQYIRNSAERCDDVATTKCSEIEELLIPKIEAEIEACENSINWVSTNIASTATGRGSSNTPGSTPGSSGISSISSSGETSSASVYDSASTVAIANVDPCGFAYRHMHQARLALEKCNRYIETCVERCGRVDTIVDECERIAADRDTIIANLTTHMRNFCTRRDITDQIRDYIDETVSSAEIVPVIAVTWLNTTESDFTFVESAELIAELDQTKIFRVQILANRMSDLRDEPFVLRAQLDNVVRAVTRAAISYAHTSAIAPNVTKHIASIEAIKESIDPTLKPEVESNEDEIETISDEVTEQENGENGRGPFYSLLRLFGLAAGTETADANFYEQKAQELNNTIASLRNIASTTSDDVAAATLLDTANEIQQKIQEMNQRAQQKRSNAQGIFSFLFGGG